MTVEKVYSPLKWGYCYSILWEMTEEPPNGPQPHETGCQGDHAGLVCHACAASASPFLGSCSRGLEGSLNIAFRRNDAVLVLVVQHWTCSLQDDRPYGFWTWRRHWTVSLMAPWERCSESMGLGAPCSGLYGPCATVALRHCFSLPAVSWTCSQRRKSKGESLRNWSHPH